METKLNNFNLCTVHTVPHACHWGSVLLASFVISLLLTIQKLLFPLLKSEISKNCFFSEFMVYTISVNNMMYKSYAFQNKF